MTERRTPTIDFLSVIGDLLEGVSGASAKEPGQKTAGYKEVSELSMSDYLVLQGGEHKVVGMSATLSEPDIVTITLDNGLSYDLINTAMVKISE